MPVKTGKDSKGCFARWGSQKKYYYTCGNKAARDRAKAKAEKQGRAAHAGGYNEQGNNMFQKVVANFDGLVRNDTMEGRDYLVAPMVMLMEGVHEGSGGKLFYPAEELSKIPAVWNAKPVVVYHPTRNGQPISACDPDIFSSRKVGTIMNTKFEDGKLKAEAWLETNRMDAVDSRIAEAVENQTMMELSTGLFTDNDGVAGTFGGDTTTNEKGLPYDSTARNYRPDHLALLPDLTGACSIEDGAGFLRLNAKPNKIKITGNALSHSNIRSMLNSWIQTKNSETDYFWIEDVYDEFFIFEAKGKFHKQDYKIEKNQVIVDTLNGSELVVKATEYRTTSGKVVGNKQDNLITKGTEMDKEKIVQSLIDNKYTEWTEDDKEALAALDEKILEKMQPAVNDKQIKKDREDAVANAVKEAVKSVKSPIANDKKEDKDVTPKTLKEYIADAPAELQPVLRNGIAAHDHEKAQLVKEITDNERNGYSKEQLDAKDIEDLRQIATLARTVTPEEHKQKYPNYAGQGSVQQTDNEHVEEPLEMAKMLTD